MAAIVGGATSITLSARLARSSRLVESEVDARTICTCTGRRCRKSSRTNGPQRLPPGLRAAVPSCGATVMVSCRPVLQLSEAVAGDVVRTLPCVGLAGRVGCRTVDWRAGGG